MTRLVVAVAVVAFVVLAGCTGGSTDVSTTGTNTTGATTTATLSDLTEQSWVASNESVVYERLFERHRRVLANASSYEFTRDFQAGTGHRTDGIAVNRDAERALLSITGQYDDAKRVQEKFVANGTVYSKSGAAEDAKYTSEDAGLTGGEFNHFVREQTRIGTVRSAAETFEFEYVGVEDGAYVFEADSVQPSEEASYDAESVTAASGRLVVAESGYVRELSVSLTVDGADGERHAELTVTTTGVNETTVSEPPWVEKA